MPIDFHCAQCGRPLQAGDASPGTRILCPACGAFSTIPASDTGSPIEFRCTGCDKLLRTPADTAGEQARCPECGKIVPVPGPAAGVPAETLPYPAAPPPPRGQPASPFASGGEPVAAGDAENPYLAPTQYGPAPLHGFAGPDAMAATRVAGPAVALIVTGALGIAGQLLGLIGNLVQIGGGMGGPRPNDLPLFLSGGIGLVMGVISILLGVVVILGAVKMKNLESYGFAMASAIIAMVPCISPCCPLGLPFGIWALVILSDAGVKAAFRG
jgi:DNA-directed RNA polymerase subunit RPC12/RpoP